LPISPRVAGEHRDVDASPREGRDRLWRLRLQLVGDGDDAKRPSAEGQINHGLAFRGER